MITTSKKRINETILRQTCEECFDTTSKLENTNAGMHHNTMGGRFSCEPVIKNYMSTAIFKYTLGN